MRTNHTQKIGDYKIKKGDIKRWVNQLKIHSNRSRTRIKADRIKNSMLRQLQATLTVKVPSPNVLDEINTLQYRLNECITKGILREHTDIRKTIVGEYDEDLHMNGYAATDQATLTSYNNNDKTLNDNESVAVDCGLSSASTKTVESPSRFNGSKIKMPRLIPLRQEIFETEAHAEKRIKLHIAIPTVNINEEMRLRIDMEPTFNTSKALTDKQKAGTELQKTEQTQTIDLEGTQLCLSPERQILKTSSNNEKVDEHSELSGQSVQNLESIESGINIGHSLETETIYCVDQEVLNSNANINLSLSVMQEEPAKVVKKRGRKKGGKNKPKALTPIQKSEISKYLEAFANDCATFTEVNTNESLDNIITINANELANNISYAIMPNYAINTNSEVHQEQTFVIDGPLEISDILTDGTVLQKPPRKDAIFNVQGSSLKPYNVPVINTGVVANHAGTMSVVTKPSATITVEPSILKLKSSDANYLKPIDLTCNKSKKISQNRKTSYLLDRRDSAQPLDLSVHSNTANRSIVTPPCNATAIDDSQSITTDNFLRNDCNMYVQNDQGLMDDDMVSFKAALNMPLLNKSNEFITTPEEVPIGQTIERVHINEAKDDPTIPKPQFPSVVDTTFPNDNHEIFQNLLNCNINDYTALEAEGQHTQQQAGAYFINDNNTSSNNQNNNSNYVLEDFSLDNIFENLLATPKKPCTETMSAMSAERVLSMLKTPKSTETPTISATSNTARDTKRTDLKSKIEILHVETISLRKTDECFGTEVQDRNNLEQQPKLNLDNTNAVGDMLRKCQVYESSKSSSRAQSVDNIFGDFVDSPAISSIVNASGESSMPATSSETETDLVKMSNQIANEEDELNLNSSIIQNKTEKTTTSVTASPANAVETVGSTISSPRFKSPCYENSSDDEQCSSPLAFSVCRSDRHASMKTPSPLREAFAKTILPQHKHVIGLLNDSAYPEAATDTFDQPALQQNEKASNIAMAVPPRMPKLKLVRRFSVWEKANCTSISPQVSDLNAKETNNQQTEQTLPKLIPANTKAQSNDFEDTSETTNDQDMFKLPMPTLIRRSFAYENSSNLAQSTIGNIRDSCDSPIDSDANSCIETQTKPKENKNYEQIPVNLDLVKKETANAEYLKEPTFLNDSIIEIDDDDDRISLSTSFLGSDDETEVPPANTIKACNAKVEIENNSNSNDISTIVNANVSIDSRCNKATSSTPPCNLIVLPTSTLNFQTSGRTISHDPELPTKQNIKITRTINRENKNGKSVMDFQCQNNLFFPNPSPFLKDTASIKELPSFSHNQTLNTNPVFTPKRVQSLPTSSSVQNKLLDSPHACKNLKIKSLMDLEFPPSFTMNLNRHNIGASSTPYIAKLFGASCLACLRSNGPHEITSKCHGASHIYPTPGLLKYHLISLTDVELFSAYKFMHTHRRLYFLYFKLFCDIFEENNNVRKLLNMIYDCMLYMDHECGSNLLYIYKCLGRCGIAPQNACRLLLERCLQSTPNASIIDILIEIIVEKDWLLFADIVERFLEVPDYIFHARSIIKMAPKALEIAETENNLKFCLILFKCMLKTPQAELPLIRSSPEIIRMVNILKTTAE